jgi:hypothetical protein
MKYRICWLDFFNTNPFSLYTEVENNGFKCIQKEMDLQVWQNKKIENLLIELLIVDQMPKEPVSFVENKSNFEIDQDRRKYCVPEKMDPYFRCLIYNDIDINNSGIILNQIFDILNVYSERNNVFIKWQD